MKICNKCKIEKEYQFFYKRKASKDGYSYSCKDCKNLIHKEYSRLNKESLLEYHRRYYSEHKDIIIDRSAKYYKENTDLCLSKSKDYYSENRDIIINRSIEYYKENTEYILDKRKDYYIENVDIHKNKSKLYRLSNIDRCKIYNKDYYYKNKDSINIKAREYRLLNKDRLNKYQINYYKDRKYIKIWRRLLYRLFKYNGKEKIDTTNIILGYSPLMLKLRIECQFKEGMSWANYGEWHVDHKKPMSKFDKDELPRTVNSLCNLQPMWKSDNMKKGNKWK